MGVFNSRKYILDKINIQIDMLKNKKIAIDMMIYIINYYNSIQCYDEKKFKIWSKKILNFIKLFYDNGIYIICVYDGLNKNTKVYNKKNIKSNNFLDNTKINELNNLILTKFKKNVEISISNADSESYCAYLYNSKKIDYIISNDSDFIFYKIDFIHIDFMFNKLNYKYEYTLYIHKIKPELLNKYLYEQIFIACLLLGTDYTKKISPKIIFEKLDNNDLNDVIDYFNKNNQSNNINYEKCLKFFTPNPKCEQYSFNTNQLYLHN